MLRRQLSNLQKFRSKVKSNKFVGYSSVNVNHFSKLKEKAKPLSSFERSKSFFLLRPFENAFLFSKNQEDKNDEKKQNDNEDDDNDFKNNQTLRIFFIMFGVLTTSFIFYNYAIYVKKMITTKITFSELFILLEQQHIYKMEVK